MSGMEMVIIGALVSGASAAAEGRAKVEAAEYQRNTYYSNARQAELKGHFEKRAEDNGHG